MLGKALIVCKYQINMGSICTFPHLSVSRQLTERRQYSVLLREVRERDVALMLMDRELVFSFKKATNYL